MSDLLYERKVSAEEAREGYLLILKNRLSQFPPVGEEFQLRDCGEVRSVAVLAEHCECRGPELPHEHYRLPLPRLTKGLVVRIRSAGGRYETDR